MNFVRGDLCQIKDVPGVQNALRGKECVVASPLLKYRGILRHHVEMTDMTIPDGHLVVAAPEHLMRLPPPYLKLDSWADCVFKPRRLQHEPKG